MSQMEKGTFASSTGQELDKRVWMPEGAPKAIVQMVHGMAEHISRYDAAVLAAINLADELYKQQEGGENLRRQLKTYLDEATAAKNEASELKRQLFKAQQRNNNGK